MDVQFIAGFSVIAPEPEASRRFYGSELRLPLKPVEDDYTFVDSLDGAKHFGIWPLHQAAQACFGTASWPADHPVPQATVEFELASPEAVGEGAAELEAAGYALLHGARTEPWGQTVARLLSPEHLIVGLSYMPPFHE